MRVCVSVIGGRDDENTNGEGRRRNKGKGRSNQPNQPTKPAAAWRVGLPFALCACAVGRRAYPPLSPLRAGPWAVMMTDPRHPHPHTHASTQGPRQEPSTHTAGPRCPHLLLLPRASPIQQDSIMTSSLPAALQLEYPLVKISIEALSSHFQRVRKQVWYAPGCAVVLGGRVGYPFARPFFSALPNPPHGTNQIR